jgi:hypothetical protein
VCDSPQSAAGSPQEGLWLPAVYPPVAQEAAPWALQEGSAGLVAARLPGLAEGWRALGKAPQPR